MADCINCNKNLNTVVTNQITAQADGTVCPTTVHENVCVQGTVTITPSVVAGDSQSFCLGNPIIGSCSGELLRECSFSVSQNICVQIPLTFSATATAVPNGVVCGTPETGECTGINGCTHTIGFFQTHSAITNALITEAGGSITLGTGSGLSIVADITNATDILGLNPPSPPAPSLEPFKGQYDNLYAQLLAAKLNVLNLTDLGVDICPFVISAIIDADNFIDTSPTGGKAGAPGFKDPLAQFNEGKAPGCPVHCNE